MKKITVLLAMLSALFVAIPAVAHAAADEAEPLYQEFTSRDSQAPETPFRCEAQAFASAPRSLVINFQGQGVSCSPGFTGTIVTQLEGPGLNPPVRTEATCTQTATCSTASTDIGCIDGGVYVALVDIIDREGNIADVDSAQATCVHCGTTTVQTVATCTDGTSLVPTP